MRHVEDKDLGWAAITRAAAKLDGLELRNGILDWRVRYPSTSGAKGTEIAKVAGIHQMYRAISEAYDSEQAATERRIKVLLRRVHEGSIAPAKLVHTMIGIPIRESMRAAVYRRVKHRSGLMGRAVRSTVFEASGIRKGGAHRGTVVAGDNPSRLGPS